jgi:HemY protein
VIRALWFFVQIAVLTAGAIWISGREGDVTLDLLGYSLKMQTGVFLIALCFVFILFLFVYRFVRAIFSIPKIVGNIREKDKKARGFQALTRGLVAVAAGDAKKASQYAKQTRALLPKQNGLPLLLDAQAARMRGDEGVAKLRFQELMRDKDAAFLGVRGLLTASIDQGDLKAALGYAQEAAKLHPKRAWVLKALYDLQIKNARWYDAENTLVRLLKVGAIGADQANSDRVALHHVYRQEALQAGDHKRALKELEKAYKIDPNFVPTACFLAEEYLNIKKKRKALNVVKKAWVANSHPDLLHLWDALMPATKKKAEEKRLKWYEELVSLKPESALGQIAAAKAAMDADMWGEAKAYLMVAERLKPTASLYRQLAIVEQHTTHDDDGIHACMEKAAMALPDKVWVCAQTGIVYEAWEPIAQPHGSFNTVTWDYPQGRSIQSADNRIAANDGLLLIDPVRA